MSLFKLFLLLLSSVSFEISLVHGTPSPDPEDKIMASTVLLERIWKLVGPPATLFLKVTMWFATIAESIVVLNSLRRTPVSPNSFLAALGPAEASQLTAPFFFGTLLIILGSIIRFAAVQAMGSYYTFIQCVRKDHKLITSGPYAVVRHPGYAGLLYTILGWWVVHGTPGSWLRTSGVLGIVWVRVGVFVAFSIMVASVTTVFRRSAEEDAYLSRRFGAEWHDWARKVRCQLVPFVY